MQGFCIHHALLCLFVAPRGTPQTGLHIGKHLPNLRVSRVERMPGKYTVQASVCPYSSESVCGDTKHFHISICFSSRGIGSCQHSKATLGYGVSLIWAGNRKPLHSLGGTRLEENNTGC